VKTGFGSATPTTHQVSVSDDSVLRYLVQHVDAIALPTVTAPQVGTGTRDVSLTKATDTAGAFATVRHLTVSGNVGALTVPVGAYGNLTANGTAGFVFGVAGATAPAVYHLQSLTMNGTGSLHVAGPVLIKLANGGTFNALVGDAARPDWLSLEVSAGNLTIGNNARVYGLIIAPNSTVTLKGSLRGRVSADRLTVEENGMLFDPATASGPTTIWVRHAPVLGQRTTVNGSVQVLSPENITLGQEVSIFGELRVPGSPSLRVKDQAWFGTQRDGTGLVTPTNYSVTLQERALVRELVRRTDAVALPTVAAPSASTGTRSVSLSSTTQSVGSFSTLRDLTVKDKAGFVTVPTGTYGTFTAGDHAGFVLGLVGATVPSTYTFQKLDLGENGSLQIVGPVVVTLATGVTLRSEVGRADHPEWLTLRVASGGVTLGEKTTVHGAIIAPNGTVTVGEDSVIHGSVAADRLSVSGDGFITQP
jgi:hypothetical protein